MNQPQQPQIQTSESSKENDIITEQLHSYLFNNNSHENTSLLNPSLFRSDYKMIIPFPGE